MSCSAPLSFIFWNKNSTEIVHNILCIAIDTDLFCTGSETGEIIIWKLHDDQYKADIICTISKEIECRALAFAKPPYPELVSCEKWIISLHSDHKIRNWDSEDGRCMSASQSSLLPDATRLDKLIVIQNRIAAISGEICEIFLVDLWSMCKLCCFVMKSPLIWIRIESDENSSQLMGLSNRNEISFWSIPDLRNFCFEKAEISKINTDSYFTLTLDEIECAKRFSCSKDGSLVAVAFENKLEIYHSSWFKILDRDKAILNTAENIIFAEFYEEFLYIVIENDKIMRYPIKRILDEIGINDGGEDYIPALLKTINMEDGRVFHLDDIELVVAKTATPLYNAQNLNNRLFSTWKNCIFLHDLSKIRNEELLPSETMKFTFKMTDFGHFADKRLHHLFKIGETIAVSNVVLCDSWPYFVVGTTSGKIFVCPFHPLQPVRTYLYHKTEITCIHLAKGKLITCSTDNVMCLWEFSNEEYNDFLLPCPRRPEVSALKRTHSTNNGSHGVLDKSEMNKHEPLSVIDLNGSPVKYVIGVSCIEDTVESINEQFWEHSWKNWEKTLLAQCEDGSIVLISMITNSVICYFQALHSKIIEAKVHVLLEYLVVACEDGYLYVYNMIIQALERVVSGFGSCMLLRKPLRKRIESEVVDQHENNNFLIDALQFNLRQQFIPYHKTALYVDNINIGGCGFPVLYLNSQGIAQAIKNIDNPGGCLEYVLSLLTCWHSTCKFHMSIVSELRNFFELIEPAVNGHLGIVGIDNALSFLLPQQKDKYDISSYSTAALNVSLFSIIESLKPIKRKVKQKLYQLTHANYSPHLVNYKYPDLAVLSLMAISGNRAAVALMQTNIPLIPKRNKKRVFIAASSLLNLKQSENRRNSFQDIAISVNKESCIPSGTIQALSALLLGYLSLESKHIKDKDVNGLVLSLKNMLKSGQKNYFILAADIIGKCMKVLRTVLNLSQVKDFICEILLCSCRESDLNKLYYKSLISIAIWDMNLFLEFISDEILETEKHKCYPLSCLIALQVLINKKYEEIPVYMTYIVELVLKTLDPHNVQIRKLCIEKAGEVLQQMVLKLPMVAFSQEKQRLAVGTLSNLIVIYDLKTATRLKILEGHDGPICAVHFSKCGTRLVSYSSDDQSLRIWKLDAGFFGGFINSMNLKPFKTLQLPEVQRAGKKYRDMLDTVSVMWSMNSRAILLMREDGKDYSYLID